MAVGDAAVLFFSVVSGIGFLSYIRFFRTQIDLCERSCEPRAAGCVFARFAAHVGLLASPARSNLVSENGIAFLRAARDFAG